MFETHYDKYMMSGSHISAVWTCSACGAYVTSDTEHQCSSDVVEYEEYAESTIRPFIAGYITTTRGPWFSFGIHVDFKHKYIDVHFIWWIVTVGDVARFERLA
jgi:hypothetical protein